MPGLLIYCKTSLIYELIMNEEIDLVRLTESLVDWEDAVNISLFCHSGFGSQPLPQAERQGVGVGLWSIGILCASFDL